jgi:hypothetical protein
MICDMSAQESAPCRNMQTNKKAPKLPRYPIRLFPPRELRSYGRPPTIPEETELSREAQRVPPPPEHLLVGQHAAWSDFWEPIVRCFRAERDKAHEIYERAQAHYHQKAVMQKWCALVWKGCRRGSSSLKIHVAQDYGALVSDKAYILLHRMFETRQKYEKRESDLASILAAPHRRRIYRI